MSSSYEVNMARVISSFQARMHLCEVCILATNLPLHWRLLWLVNFTAFVTHQEARNLLSPVGGVLDSLFLDYDSVKKLEKMPTKLELIRDAAIMIKKVLDQLLALTEAGGFSLSIHSSNSGSREVEVTS